MPAIDTLANTTPARPIAARRSRLAAIGAALLTFWRARAERRALATLSDEALRDIGLQRADVERELAAPFWQPVDYAALNRQRDRSRTRRGR